MFQLTRAEQLVVIVLLAGVLVAAGLFYHRAALRTSVTPEVVEEPAAVEEKSAEIHVDVGGAVWWPRVYRLPSGARVSDLLARAFPRDDADLDSINRARVLRDGEKVTVPSRGGAGPGEAGESRFPGGTDSRVNINTAGVRELDSLPGIGPARALAIVAYRERHGQFMAVEELAEGPGMSRSLLASRQPAVTVEE